MIESRFPKEGGWIDVVIGADLKLADTADLARAIERVEAAMTPAEQDQVDEWLAMTQAACARRPASEETAEVVLSLYSAAMRQYPADVARAACMHFATKRGTNWFPALGELLEVADRMALPRQMMLATLRNPPKEAGQPFVREPADVRKTKAAEIMAGLNLKTVGDPLKKPAEGGL